MAFDADTFMNETLDDALDTKVVPIPEGEYEATIEDVVVRQFESKKIDEKTGAPRVITTLDITYLLLDNRVAQELGRETVKVRGNIFLDLNEFGKIDTSKGKNISLGRLREAVRQNTPGQPWAFGMLKGAGPVMIKVTQRPGDSDDVIYNDVKSVTGI